jgi:Xaa-Pro aminopeptidase
MVLSLEMPYYVYGVGAFQLESMVLVTTDGHELFDQLPFDLAIELAPPAGAAQRVGATT